MRFLVLLLVLCMTVLFSFANHYKKANVDSMVKSLDTISNAKYYLLTLQKVARYYTESDLTESDYYAKVLLDTSIALNNKKYHQIAERIIALNYAEKGEYKQSVVHYNLSLDIAKEIDNDTLIGNTYNGLANVYSLLSSTQKSIKFYKLALFHFKKAEFSRGSFYVLHNLSDLYSGIGQFVHAEELLNTSLEKGLKSNNGYIIPDTYLALAILEMLKEKHENSLSYLYKAKYNAELYDRETLFYEIELELSKVHYELGDWDSAYWYCNRTIEMLEGKNRNTILAQAKFKLGKILWAKNQYTSAKKVFRETISLIEGKDRIDIELEAHLNLSQCLEEDKNFKWASHHFTRYVELKDSLFKRKNDLLIMDMALSYDSDKKEKHIKILEKENELDKTRNNLVMILTLLLIIISAWSIRVLIIKKRQKQMELDYLNRERKIAELEKLHSQISPRFLFNTLQNLAQLAMKDSSKAEDMIIGLSDFCRYSINAQNKKEACMSEVKEILEVFLDLEGMAFDDIMQIDIAVSNESLDCKIPRNLLLSIIILILNKRKTNSEIYIKLRTVFLDNVLQINIDYVGQDIREKEVSGFGLTNIYDNLNLFFAGDYSIDFNESDKKSVKIKLSYV